MGGLAPCVTFLLVQRLERPAITTNRRRHGGVGGATPQFWTPTTPPTNCWPEAPWGGGGGGQWRGGSGEGKWGGGGVGGAWGGWGVSYH